MKCSDWAAKRRVSIAVDPDGIGVGWPHIVHHDVDDVGGGPESARLATRIPAKTNSMRIRFPYSFLNLNRTLNLTLLCRAGSPGQLRSGLRLRLRIIRPQTIRQTTRHLFLH